MIGRLFYRIFKKNKPFIHKSVIIWGRDNLKIENTSGIYEYAIIRCKTNKVIIGNHCQIGPSCVIFDGSGIEINDYVMIGPHTVLAGGNHNFNNPESPMIFSGDYSKGKIIIEKDVWIGSNCTILDGVTIGEGSIVGANSLVSRDVEPYSIVGGYPAKLIKKRFDNETKE